VTPSSRTKKSPCVGVTGMVNASACMPSGQVELQTVKVPGPMSGAGAVPVRVKDDGGVVAQAFAPSSLAPRSVRRLQPREETAELPGLDRGRQESGVTHTGRAS
jgi:hypothetical protein